MKMKNLLIISNDFPDKDNNYIRNIFVKEQIRFIKNYFDNVYVISPLAYGMDRLRNSVYNNYEFDNVKVFFPKYFNFPLFYFYGRDFWIHLERNCVINLIRKENLEFDLIHAHFTWPSGVVATELKKFFNVPVIITEHTSSTFQRSIEKKDEMFINAWKNCDAIIRVRQRDIFLFEDVGIPKNKIFYVPNGFNSSSFFRYETFKCRNKLNLPEDRKIVLNVGNLYSEVKGHKYLVEAMGYVVKTRKDVICYIIGGGKLENKLKKQIKSAGLLDYIVLVGGRPHDKIPLWMNACDVFVLPSLNEGNPTVMFECLGCGKPFIGTKVGGVPEIIKSNDYGLLCDPAKSTELAENILLALDKDWNCNTIKKYSAQFSWDKISKQILQIYSQVITKSLH
jgi:glycosyltransferase involved in cell wall biosynthesis